MCIGMKRELLWVSSRQQRARGAAGILWMAMFVVYTSFVYRAGREGWLFRRREPSTPRIEYVGLNDCDPIRWALWGKTLMTSEGNDFHEDHDKELGTGENGEVVNVSGVVKGGKKDRGALAKDDGGKMEFYGSRGPNGERSPDEYVFQTFYRGEDSRPDQGFFVEVGAGDGMSGSNTLFFEKKLGWSGILVEGSTPNVNMLKRAKRAENVTRIYTGACSKAEVVDFVGEGDGAGILKFMAASDRTKREREWKDQWKKPYKVKCEKLSGLLRTRKVVKIDLMTVDVEGAELDVLKGVDWDSVFIRVLVVDLDSLSENVKIEVRKLLMVSGFCRVEKLGPDEYWTSDSTFKNLYCGWSSFKVDP